jgi:hypothetical protein
MELLKKRFFFGEQVQRVLRAEGPTEIVKNIGI